MASLLALYLVGYLTRQGIALDGLVYANIAHLLSTGEGDFLHLPFYVNDELVYTFPPFGIYLMSLWTTVFGSAFWVEKSFSALMTLGVFVTTASIYREVVPAASRAGGLGRSAAWPILLLAVMPVVTHTLKNNYLESPLTFLTLIGAWAAYRARTRPRYLVLVVAATLLAVLTKGLVALFVLVALPVFIWTCEHDLKRSVRAGVLTTILCLAATAAAIWCVPELRIFSAHYWDQQLAPSIAGEVPIVHDRAYQLARLATNLAYPGAIVLALLLTGVARPTRQGVPWLLIGTAASLPLLLSSRHFEHYLLPAMPFFALGLALTCDLCVGALRPSIVRTALGAASVALFATVWIGYRGFGDIGKDVAEINEAAATAVFASGSAVQFCDNGRGHDVVMAYLYRNHRVRSYTRTDERPRSRPVVCPTRSESRSPSRRSV